MDNENIWLNRSVWSPNSARMGRFGQGAFSFFGARRGYFGIFSVMDIPLGYVLVYVLDTEQTDNNRILCIIILLLILFMIIITLDCILLPINKHTVILLFIQYILTIHIRLIVYTLYIFIIHRRFIGPSFFVCAETETGANRGRDTGRKRPFCFGGGSRAGYPVIARVRRAWFNR